MIFVMVVVTFDEGEVYTLQAESDKPCSSRDLIILDAYKCVHIIILI